MPFNILNNFTAPSGMFCTPDSQRANVRGETSTCLAAFAKDRLRCLRSAFSSLPIIFRCVSIFSLPSTRQERSQELNSNPIYFYRSSLTSFLQSEDFDTKESSLNVRSARICISCKLSDVFFLNGKARHFYRRTRTWSIGHVLLFC